MSALGRRLGVAVVLAALLVLLGVRVGDCCDTWVPAASADALMLTPQALATAAAHCEPVDESSIDCCISAGDHRTELATDRTRAAAPHSPTRWTPSRPPPPTARSARLLRRPCLVQPAGATPSSASA